MYFDVMNDDFLSFVIHISRILLYLSTAIKHYAYIEQEDYGPQHVPDQQE